MSHTSKVLQAINVHAAASPDRIALENAHTVLTYAELAFEISRMQRHLLTAPSGVLGVCVENCPAWAVTDLAAITTETPVVPLPGFFSAAQMAHAIQDAGITQIISDHPIVIEHLLQAHHIRVSSRQRYQVADRWLTLFRLSNIPARSLPHGTAKITYTSGTTGDPKGVCLSQQAIEQVAESLMQATEASAFDRHLSLMPLTTLLENIAGLYVPLLAGARSILRPSHEVGLSGATGLNPQVMLQAILTSPATTLVLTPELLKALVLMVEAGAPVPSRLRFIAVGGATVSINLLERATAVGLPVFEGYGLSESCSVVAVNTPQAHRAGTVGKLLPHVQVKLADDGEILVAGATMLGYTGMASDDYGNQFWPTGDLGDLDDDGFLTIHGRKKNVFITSFGRNVSPEWVESQLAQSAQISQAALFGEARPWNVALIVPASGATSQEIDAIVERVNAGLPDYARVREWLLAEAPFSVRNQQLTPNFRLRRDQIWQAYAPRIEALYQETLHVCV